MNEKKKEMYYDTWSSHGRSDGVSGCVQPDLLTFNPWPTVTLQSFWPFGQMAYGYYLASEWQGSLSKKHIISSVILLGIPDSCEPFNEHKVF